MVRWLTSAILCSFLIGVHPTNAHDYPDMLKYPGEYIRHLDIIVNEDESGSISIVKIGRWSPFRRYPWFRAGDTIDEVEEKKASLISLRSLIRNQDAWISYTRGEYSHRVQINLKLNFFGLPPWVNYVKGSGTTHP
ncbi:MAG: hypothetical protein HN472_14400 [Nitrospina sp.]|jgi:hypothetical protein|nr:hypothetical protein [Nitrospina sp.]MBT3510725.1 hypothetical protein [Nitrospina sp.]MBT3875994.1 hypothetical protein [Nitrospina sp.]MBT4048963.1 hypothetical protein [Nitrospina sp.]MBT4557641.1 hypothetical protein [Nitrospina sp.]